MTFRIVEVQVFEEPQQGLYGLVSSRSFVRREGILTLGYALKVRQQLIMSREYDECSDFVVRDEKGRSYYSMPEATIPCDDDIPF